MMIIGGITEAIITNPNVAVPLLRAYGFSKGLSIAVMSNLAKIATTINQLPQGKGSFTSVIPSLSSPSQ